jgi:hypothetical protein
MSLTDKGRICRDNDDGDTINLYDRAADRSIALATGSVRQLLSWLDGHGRDS